MMDGNSVPNMYNEAIGGVPNKFITTALTSWAGNHNHTVSLTISGGHHNRGGSTSNSGSNEIKPKNVALLYSPPQNAPDFFIALKPIGLGLS